MKKILAILLFCCVFPTYALALSDADHAYFLKHSPEYRQADAAMTQMWKKVFTPLKGKKRQEMLDSQRQWIRTYRDQIAEDFMEVGLSRPQAYARATFRRVNELRYLNYNLTMQSSASKPLDYFLDDTDYPSYYAKSNSNKRSEEPTPPKKEEPKKKEPKNSYANIEDDDDGDDMMVNYKGKANNVPAPSLDEKPVQKKIEPTTNFDNSNIVTKLTAAEAIDEFKQNKLRFDSKYKNKTLTIKGFVSDLQYDDNLYVIHLSGSESDSSNYIICNFDEENKDVILTLNTGDSISVIGLYLGNENSNSIKLSNCKVEL